MAKKASGSKLVGPLYTQPGKSLGGAEVEGPKALTIPDPLHFNKTNKGK